MNTAGFRSAAVLLLFCFGVLFSPVSAGSVVVQNGQLNATGNFYVGAGSFFVNSTSGYVGIGTTSPQQKLVVRGNLTVGHEWDGATTTAPVYFGKPASGGGFGAGSAFMSFVDAGSGAGVNYGTGIAFTPHQGGSAQAEAVRIAGNGNVGIGTASPSEKLDIEGGNLDMSGNNIRNTYEGDWNYVYNGNFETDSLSGWSLYRVGASYLSASVTNSDAKIGNRSAVITETSNQGDINYRLYMPLPSDKMMPGQKYTIGLWYKIPVGSNLYAYYIGIDYDWYNTYGGSNLPAANIADGTWHYLSGVVTTDASNKVYYLNMVLGGADEAGQQFFIDGVTVTRGTQEKDWFPQAPDVMAGVFYGNVGIGTTTPGYTLTVAGTAWVTSGSWSGSDARWKKNVTALSSSSSLEKVLALKPVNFLWKTAEYPNMGFTNGTQVGFIAQDVEKVIPEVITTDDKGYKGISYERVVPVIAGAVQEQQAEITRLRAEKDAEISGLRADNEAQQAQMDLQQSQVSALNAGNEQLKEIVCADHPQAQACK
ncbi:MAG: tail fiber domain-containing protein [Candidatus Micrarchaeia archaeon]